MFRPGRVRGYAHPRGLPVGRGCTIALRYAVGIKVGNKADQVTVEAEHALIAALKVKAAHADAVITYVRKQNARGDRRHPHSDQAGEPGRARAGSDRASRSLSFRAAVRPD